MLVVRNRCLEALELFQSGRYFDAHEAFEELWRESEGAERDFYQGWLLLAAALFHRDRGNSNGSKLCFERAETHWSELPVRFRGVSVPETLKAVDAVLEQEWVKPELPPVPTGTGRGTG